MSCRITYVFTRKSPRNLFVLAAVFIRRIYVYKKNPFKSIYACASCAVYSYLYIRVYMLCAVMYLLYVLTRKLTDAYIRGSLLRMSRGAKEKSISYEPYIRDAVDLNFPRVARIDTIVRSRTCNQIHRM